MRNVLIPLAAAIGLCAAAFPAAAHHSHGLTYDACIPVTVEGTVERVEWGEPHVLIHFKTDDGVMYRADWTSPQGLRRRGIDEDTVKTGVRVVVTGAPLRPLDQLDPSVRSRYRDLTFKILDVLHIRDAGGKWTYGLDVMPNSQNCARGFVPKDELSGTELRRCIERG